MNFRAVCALAPQIRVAILAISAFAVACERTTHSNQPFDMSATPDAAGHTDAALSDDSSSANDDASVASSPDGEAAFDAEDEAAASILDRLDFGNPSSEQRHGLHAGTNAAQGMGAFSQTYRQPKLVEFGVQPAEDDKLTFQLAVDPDAQNYVTVKLFGSDIQFGVLSIANLSDVEDRAGVARPGFANQLDNNISNGTSNPPFYGRFHYATTALPLSLTAGKSAVVLSLCSTGYYYDSGGDRAGQPTRPVYTAFTHTNPYFVPPGSDATGPVLAQVGTAPPPPLDRAAVFRVLKRSRANIHGLDGVPDGFWNPGGSLAWNGSVIPSGTPGAPPEVIGMHMWDGPLRSETIAEINASESPADTWRNNVQGRQTGAIALHAAVYLTPPLEDQQGNIVAGHDKYLDPAVLDRFVALLDGQARSQGGDGTSLSGWDNSCSGGGWVGVTSTPRRIGAYAGSKSRNGGNCLTFTDQLSDLSISLLHLLEHPDAAAAFRAKLSQMIDADFDGRMMTRAAMYERMLATAGRSMGFGLQALTSDDWFDKFGGTAVQAMIWVGGAYPAQLALRALLEHYPTSDVTLQPIDPATMRAIVRQLSGLDDMKFMQDFPPGGRVITRSGISETYGTLASGHDGRYGDAIAPGVAKFAMLMKYDDAMTPADRDEAAAMARRTISAFTAFLHPQHAISTDERGAVVDTYLLGPEDVISWRVPYGPNANGWRVKVPAVAVAPGGIIGSPQARRAFFLNASREGVNSTIGDWTNYKENEDAWKSLAEPDAASVPLLPGEPTSPNFVWADVESGAFAMAHEGERLFFNAHYNRGKSKVNQYVRVHHVSDLVDRQATVLMPFDTTTTQSDGNASGDFDGAWVVRYGRYLAVLNRSRTAYVVKLPVHASAEAVRRGKTVIAADAPLVAPGDYELFVLR